MALKDLLNSMKRETVILDELNRFLQSSAKQASGFVKDEREKGIWHVSQLRNCDRGLLFQRLGFKTKSSASARGEKIFDTGHHYGYRMQEYLYYMKNLYGEWKCRSCGHRWLDMENPSPRVCPKCEEKLYLWYNLDYLEIALRDDNLGIAGHADGAFKSRGKFQMLELKTIKSRTERTHPRSVCFEDLNAPKEAHLWQVGMYMYLTTVMKDMPNIEQGVIVYGNKNSQEDKEFPVKLMKELYITPQLEKVKSLNEHLENKTLPDRPEGATGKSSWGCKFCGYKDICYALDSNKVTDYKGVK